MKTEYEDQILAAIAAVKDRFAQGRVKNVYFVACGGSKATMMPAQYMLDREIETPAAIYTSNEFNYGTPKAFGKDSIVFTISHSGTTPRLFVQLRPLPTPVPSPSVLPTRPTPHCGMPLNIPSSTNMVRTSQMRTREARSNFVAGLNS
jgi:predicted metal-binding protein